MAALHFSPAAIAAALFASVFTASAQTPPPPPTGATAALVTQAGQPAGRVMLNQLANGVEVIIEASGLAPGLHGFHFHKNGACAPGPDAAEGQIVPFGAAGGHFDPMATMNHGHPDEPASHVHGGDLPNLVVGADGRGTLRAMASKVTVAPGKTSVLGRTVVVHERADDYQSDPAGNSGPRLLCGLIVAAGPSSVLGRATFEGSNVFPEGIAIDRSTGTAYVGSSTEGNLYRIADGADKAELFSPGGSPGRQGAFGMQLDANGRLWVAGGPSGTLALVDAKSGATLASYKVPPLNPPAVQSFVNDLVLNRDGYVYITDSFRPVLYRMKGTANATTQIEPWLDLAATPIRYQPNEINLNGIVASPDGRWLLAIQSITGQLWRIDTRTKAVAEVRTDGDLKNGDGLVLDGSTLYVVRNVEGEVARIALEPGWSKARVTQRFHDARLKYPTTAAISSRGLVVVNGQLDKQKEPPPLLPFDTVTIPK